MNTVGYHKGQIELLLIFTIIILFSYFIVGGLFPKRDQLNSPTTQTSQTQYIVSNQLPPATQKKTLQLNSLPLISVTPAIPPASAPILTPVPITIPPAIPTTPITPPPADVCAPDNGQQCTIGSCSLYLVTCSSGNCVNVVNGPQVFGTFRPMSCFDVNNIHHYDFGDPNREVIGWCNSQELAPGGTGTFCLDKPVIYLYPTKDTLVDVTLSLSGKIVVSIPTYEEEGWQDVLAHPDGTLEYRGQTYRELFYESDVPYVLPPKNGIIVPKNELQSKLDYILTRLGLIDFEKKEFLSYWVPRLSNLEGEYILFSLIEPGVKEKIDKINISPEPDTRIEILAYFKPLTFPQFITPLILPDKPPKRAGFTMVEWGGTIDQ